MVERLFLAVSQGCLRFVIVVFPDHTHLLFLMLEKFGDNQSLIANVCPGFYTSSKTSIGFYARKCIQEYSSVGE